MLVTWVISSVGFLNLQRVLAIFFSMGFAVGAFYFGFWFVECGCRTDCRVLSFLTKGSEQGGEPVRRIRGSFKSFKSNRKSFLSLLWVLVCIRFGEALHPGPGNDTLTWSVGLCNPNGLQGKLDQVETLPGHVWFVCETHFSQLGLMQFRRALRHTKSKFRYCVAGAVTPYRSQAAVGTHSGVALISQLPARSLPHSIPQDLYNSGRVQIAGFCVNHHWVQAGVIYGYPDSAKHAERTYRTEVLLSEVIDRVAIASSGLRMILGDFNHSEQELTQLGRLKDLGFIEAQTFAFMQWGVSIKSTCKRQAPIDQCWLSPELQSLLVGVEIRDCDFSDHSSVLCAFSSNFVPLSRFHWRMPADFQWPELNDTPAIVDWISNPTAAYASFWNQIEQEAKLKTNCVSRKVLGRGQTLDTKVTTFAVPPCKVARNGDFQPSFHGADMTHLRWVKQLRRLQALRRLAASNSSNPMHHVRKVEVWSAIRNAPGFPGGFANWWVVHFPSHVFAEVGFPLCMPNLEELRSMTDLFRTQVEKLEEFHKLRRIHFAKERRKDNLQLLFRDCADEQPSKVDTLLQHKTVGIDQVQHEDCSVVLTSALPLREDKPVVVAGVSRKILIACEDQVWLDNIDGITPGDSLVQDVLHTSDSSILQQFEQVWSSRWIKMSHLAEGQWQRVADFVQAKFRPLPWTFPDWDDKLFRQSVLKKKTHAAVGPDGVSKKDLQALPVSKSASLLQLFSHLEAGECEWPQQLTTGFVSSLYKGRGDGGVDSFRPITVFPMLYRMWSSARARQAMVQLAKALPTAIRGGVPSRESRTIWYELSQIIETSQSWNTPAQGLVFDVCKAFNCLPREPIWLILKHLAFPLKILMPWAKFTFQAKRRFKVRSSTGRPIGSVVGYPEGCGLSVFAMTVLDWLVSEWTSSLVGSPIDMLAYVDDWQIMFRSSCDFPQIWAALNFVVQALDLTLDHAKSFLWASLAEDRKQLQDAPLQIALAARDLGAHQNFCRKAGNKTIVDRISSMQPKWTMLRACRSPYHHKAMALRQLAWPRALHACSIVKIGPQHFRSLRTGAIRALNADKIGANPLLHLGSISVNSDPEAWASLQTIKDARSLGNHNSLRSSLELLRNGDQAVPSNAPAVVLKERCANFGWELGPEGNFHDQFGAFDLLTCSWAEVLFRAQCGWPKRMAAEVCHRATFEGIQFCDLEVVAQSLKAFSEADRIFVRSAMDGTLYCDIGKDKEQRGSESRCQFCGMQDSFEHRIWHCKTFEKARQQSKFRHLISELPSCLKCHAWPILSFAWVQLVKYFDGITRVDKIIRWPTDPLPPIVDLFVDGSCACPQYPRVRFASWAVTMAIPNFSVFDYKVIHKGHLSGVIQTSYRAELTALLVAFQFAAMTGVKVRIWSDNQAAVTLGRQLLRRSAVKRNSHSDLVGELAFLAESLTERVDVVKVVSHCDQSAAEDQAEAWAFWQNSKVDWEAGQINDILGTLASNGAILAVSERCAL